MSEYADRSRLIPSIRSFINKSESLILTSPFERETVVAAATVVAVAVETSNDAPRTSNWTERRLCRLRVHWPHPPRRPSRPRKRSNGGCFRRFRCCDRRSSRRNSTKKPSL